MGQMLGTDTVTIQRKQALAAVKSAVQAIDLHGIRLAWLLFMLHKLCSLPRDLCGFWLRVSCYPAVLPSEQDYWSPPHSVRGGLQRHCWCHSSHRHCRNAHWW